MWLHQDLQNEKFGIKYFFPPKPVCILQVLPDNNRVCKECEFVTDVSFLLGAEQHAGEYPWQKRKGGYKTEGDCWSLREHPDGGLVTIIYVKP